MKIYLVRHGQTDWNFNHRFQGWADIELDTVGMIQAKMLTNYFKDVEIDHMYTSDLSRSLKTAQYIQKSLLCPLTLSHDLREMNVGNWEGLTWEEIQEAYQDDLIQYENQLFGVPISGGESLVEFQNRVVSLFMKLIEKEYQNLCIVTHGGVIRVLLCYLLGYDLSQRDLIKIDNASISILEVGPENRINILEQNIIKHLSNP
ncbi:MAG: alpha-ribazole phosphatase [Acholeplasmataceae bacterium]|nr:alpha-ribazole phosphatase [Acholeplasmataceae bacterium]